MPKPLEFPRVPILGQPCTVFDVAISAVVLCNCSDDNTPFLLSSRHPLTCAKCAGVYAIVASSMDLSQGKALTVGVGQIGKAAQSEQLQ